MASEPREASPLDTEILGRLASAGTWIVARTVAHDLRKPFADVRDALVRLSEEDRPRVERSKPVLGGGFATYRLGPPENHRTEERPMKWIETKIEELTDATAAVLRALNKEDHLAAAEMDRDAVWWLVLRSLVNIKSGDVEITGFGLELVEKLLSVEVVT